MRGIGAIAVYLKVNPDHNLVRYNAIVWLDFEVDEAGK